MDMTQPGCGRAAVLWCAGDAVAKPQRLLKITVDSDFGQDREIRQRVPKSKKLTVAGKVGPQTWGRLSNVQFVYEAGNDTMFGGGLCSLQDAVKDAFDSEVCSPRIIDYTEYETLLRLLRKWNDPTILVGHSCGCNAITHAALALSMERIPYLLAIAPSIYCPVASLPPNIERATQANSNAFDFFNPLGRTLLYPSPVNCKTKLDVISTGRSHLTAPYDARVRARLITEVRNALAA